MDGIYTVVPQYNSDNGWTLQHTLAISHVTITESKTFVPRISMRLIFSIIWFFNVCSFYKFFLFLLYFMCVLGFAFFLFSFFPFCLLFRCAFFRCRCNGSAASSACRMSTHCLIGFELIVFSSPSFYHFELCSILSATHWIQNNVRQYSYFGERFIFSHYLVLFLFLDSQSRMLNIWNWESITKMLPIPENLLTLNRVKNAISFLWAKMPNIWEHLERVTHRTRNFPHALRYYSYSVLCGCWWWRRRRRWRMHMYGVCVYASVFVVDTESWEGIILNVNLKQQQKRRWQSYKMLKLYRILSVTFALVRLYWKSPIESDFSGKWSPDWAKAAKWNDAQTIKLVM